MQMASEVGESGHQNIVWNNSGGSHQLLWAGLSSNDDDGDDKSVFQLNCNGMTGKYDSNWDSDWTQIP